MMFGSADKIDFEKIFSQKRLICFFWFIAIILAALYGWSGRQAMNPDGMSYLDIADAYRRGDWKAAVNGYWSPLYSWLLAIALYLLKPSPYWEFSVVHLVNFLIFLFALACFQFFLFELSRYRQWRKAKITDEGYAIMADWAISALGYILFIWSSLNLITVSIVTPDMCNTAFVYLACAILLYLKRKPGRWFIFVVLGLVFGFGYLARGMMLLLFFIFLGISAYSVKDFKKIITLVLLAIFSFLIVAGPHIIALSRTKGRLTFGDTAKLAYAWCVNNVPLVHWQGEPLGSGRPEHPSRKIFDHPEIYEFSRSASGTYPVWYDPSYWSEGVVLHFDLRGHWKVLLLSLKEYYYLFSYISGFLILGFLIICFMGCARPACLKGISEYWVLFVPAIIVIIAYSLVHSEARYIAAFFVLLWMALFSGLRLPKNHESKRSILFVVLFIILQIMFLIVNPALPTAYKAVRSMVKGEGVSGHLQWQVANGLKQTGIDPGDKVAVTGYGFGSYWARLGGVKIIAQVMVKNDNIFWIMDDALKVKVFKILKGTGAKAIVAENLPACVSASGWQKIGNTDYHVYLF
jgi:hypothetical protein